MRLKSLRLINFRNYREETVDFDSGFTSILGPNGAGKTNILEAIHYLCLTRNSSGVPDALSIRSGERFFSIMGSIERDGKAEEVRLTYSEQGKSLSRNGKEVRRFADHIGTLPLVMVAPRDISLIWEAGEERRRFFDQWMSQVDRAYLLDLIEYNHLLKQRNALLRKRSDGDLVDLDLVRLYHRSMAGPAGRIIGFRIAFMERIAPILVDLYRKIGGLSEPVELIYDPSFSAGDPLEIWETGLERDLAAGRTTLGPHRDGFRFLLSGQEVQKTGSQGQQKTFLVALKMAAHTTLGQSCGIPPLLLLDDIFDKLDENRTRNLLALAGSGTFGQVILTDANPDRALSRLREAGIPYGDIVLGQATRSRP